MEQSSRKNSAVKANHIQSTSLPTASPQLASPHLPAPASPPQPTASPPRHICSPSFESHRSFSLEEDEERVPYCTGEIAPRGPLGFKQRWMSPWRTNVGLSRPKPATTLPLFLSFLMGEMPAVLLSFPRGWECWGLLRATR